MRGGITGEVWRVVVCRRAEAEAHLCERAQRRGRFLKTAGLDLKKQAATGEKGQGCDCMREGMFNGEMGVEGENGMKTSEGGGWGRGRKRC